MNPPSIVLLPYPIFMSPKERFSYFVPPQNFDLGGMLGNPMMLLMIGGGAMMLAMPYLIVSPLKIPMRVLTKQSSRRTLIQKLWRNSKLKMPSWVACRVLCRAETSRLGESNCFVI